MASLRTLSMHHNNLKSLSAKLFEHLLNLNFLALENNLIEEFPKLESLTNLEFLRLSFNYITQLRTTTFTGLSSLKTIWLNNNSISSVSANSYNGLTAALSIAKFTGNPIPLCAHAKSALTHDFQCDDDFNSANRHSCYENCTIPTNPSCAQMSNLFSSGCMCSCMKNTTSISTYLEGFTLAACGTEKEALRLVQEKGCT